MSYDRIVDRALLELPGAFRSIVRDEAKRVARAFCRDTLAWQQTDSLWLPAGQVDVDLYPPSGSELVALISIADMTRGADYHQPTPTLIRLTRAPSVTETRQAMLALAPSSAAADLPAILSVHEDALVHGVVARLARIPAVEWSSPQTAQVNHALWQAAVAEAHQKTQTGHAFGARSVKFRKFV